MKVRTIAMQLFGLSVVLFQPSTLVAASTTAAFRLDRTTTVTVRVTGNRLYYRTEGEVNSSGEISIATEKAIHLKIEDYNFDGIKDLSVWYVDEGMGIYKIYRIFLYSKKENKFLEQHPVCGDEFINLRRSARARLLESTYFEGNTLKVCVTRLPALIN